MPEAVCAVNDKHLRMLGSSMVMSTLSILRTTATRMAAGMLQRVSAWTGANRREQEGRRVRRPWYDDERGDNGQDRKQHRPWEQQQQRRCKDHEGGLDCCAHSLLLAERLVWAERESCVRETAEVQLRKANQ
jgi:hypothetical protein